MSLNTTPRTWVAGETVTATLMNTEVRDALTGIQAAWTAYAPTWTATSNPSLGNGVMTGAYQRIGKTIFVKIDLSIGTTTTFGSGNWVFSIPVSTGWNQGVAIGSGVANTSGGVKALTVVVNSSASIYLLRASNDTVVSSSAPGSYAANNYFRFSMVYEAA